nr:N-acetylmuramoyl-L-alanine amidase [Sphingomonas sp. SFZ2018-12]
MMALIAAWCWGIPGWAGLIDGMEIAPGRLIVRADARLGVGPAIAIDIDAGAGAIRARPPGLAPRTELRVTVVPTADARFARALAERRAGLLPPFSYVAAAAAPPERVRIALPPARPTPPLPPVAGGDPTRPLVVIDPGHGGHDPGAVSDGLREKDLTLAIARAIRDRLVADGRVRVALTRDDDRFLVLQERYGIARRLRADLFVSIHCDSAQSTAASGASAYTLSEVASDKEAARLAARENRADLLAGVDLDGAQADVSSILIDLAQRETMTASAGFVDLLARALADRVPMRARFHRMASLVVLKAPDLPSVLFEAGYVSNPADAERLASRAGQDGIAAGMARAVEVHFARRLASQPR